MPRWIWKWLRGWQPEREADGAPADGHCQLTRNARPGRLTQPGVHDIVIVKDMEAGS